MILTYQGGHCRKAVSFFCLESKTMEDEVKNVPSEEVTPEVAPESVEETVDKTVA